MPLPGARPPRSAAPGQARCALTPVAAPPRPRPASPRAPRAAPARVAVPWRPAVSAARSGFARSARASSTGPCRAAPCLRPCVAAGQAGGDRGGQGGPARRGGLPGAAPARPSAPGGSGRACGSASGIWQAPAGSSQVLAARSSAGPYAAAAGVQAPAAAAPSAKASCPLPGAAAAAAPGSLAASPAQHHGVAFGLPWGRGCGAAGRLCAQHACSGRWEGASLCRKLAGGRAGGAVSVRATAARSLFMPIQRLRRLGMQAHDCVQRTAQRGRVGQAVRAGDAGRCKPPARAPPGARHGRLQREHGGGLARKLTAQLRLLRAQLAQQGRHLPMACGQLQCMPAACAGAQCTHSTWHPGVAQRARATASAWRAGSGARGAARAACAAHPAGPPLVGSDRVGNVRICSVVLSLRLFPAPAGATQGRPGRPGRCLHFSRVLLPLVLLPHVTHNQPHACEGPRPAYARSRAPHLLCLVLRTAVRGQRRRRGRRVRRTRSPLQSPAWRRAWLLRGSRARPCGRRCAAARAGLRVPARQASHGLASRAGAGPVHPSGSDLCARGGSPARPVLCILACSYPPTCFPATHMTSMRSAADTALPA